MARPKPISGFPEFLSTARLPENQLPATFTSTFELHRFAPLETRAAESPAPLSL